MASSESSCHQAASTAFVVGYVTIKDSTSAEELATYVMIVLVTKILEIAFYLVNQLNYAFH